MLSRAEQTERRTLPGSLMTSGNPSPAWNPEMPTSGLLFYDRKSLPSFSRQLFWPSLLNQHRPSLGLLSLQCGCLCKMKKQPQGGECELSEVMQLFLHKHFTQTCVKRLLKQTAPASGVGAETEAWGACTAGLISEAHDTVEALATVAAVSPVVPRPP